MALFHLSYFIRKLAYFTAFFRLSIKPFQRRGELS
jgi:hypothetical protein